MIKHKLMGVQQQLADGTYSATLQRVIVSEDGEITVEVVFDDQDMEKS